MYTGSLRVQSSTGHALQYVTNVAIAERGGPSRIGCDSEQRPVVGVICYGHLVWHFISSFGYVI